MDRERIAVVGAGQIGRSVAHTLAEYGDEVTLIDISDEALASALTDIRRAHLGRLLRKVTAVPVDEVMNRIHVNAEIDSAHESRLIVENVTEKVAVKLEVHQAIAGLPLRPDVMIGVNSSAVPISLIAPVYQAPDRVVGMHFMNPVTETRAVEVVRQPAYAGSGAVDEAVGLLKARGLSTVTVNDGVGYVANRALMTFINEAVGCVARGTAEPRQVDEVFKVCAGHRQGPLETADLIGLDTVLLTLDVIKDLTDDPRYEADPFLRSMVSNGQLGRKSGRGFYCYRSGSLS